MPGALNRTVDNVVDNLFGSFEQYWRTDGLGAPLAWPNVAFDPKAAGNQNGWVRVTLIHAAGASGQQTLGSNPVFRRIATFGLSVYTRAGRGRQRNDELVEACMRFIEDHDAVSNVWFRDQSFNEVGPDDQGWYLTNVTAQMVYDIIRN